MEKMIETAMIKRETAMGVHKPKLDFEIGDYVQIRANAKTDVGRIGEIIGIRYKEFDSGLECLLYTVRFSDTEAGDFAGINMTFVHSSK